VSASNAIRGSRVGASPVRWAESPADRSETVARRTVGYWCANGHHTEQTFAAEVDVPALWDCPRCGLPAGPDEENPPARPRTEPYKTHLAYVKERRSEADAEAILAEAIARVRARRGR
jgi:hypothetical protein